MATIATVSGTALIPGVSRNKRLYSHEVIGKAVNRAQQRLAQGGMPLTMMVSHPKPEDGAYVPVTKIVGRVTELWQEPDGRARFKAELVDTAEGTDVLKLVDNSGKQPVLKGVSIRGGWLGQTRRVVLPGGDMAETADDLELDGLDYTHRPGVPGAEVEHVAITGTQPRESGPDGRTPITESVQEALVETTQEAAAPAAKAEPYGDVTYADPGYQKDKKKRYPLDTKAHARAAWSYVNQADNAKLYTAAQLKRVRQRIIKALKGFGVAVDVKEGWTIDPIGAITESSLLEHYGMDDQPGSFCINLSNGPLCISISSYCIDPHDLDAIGRAAMGAACAALAAIDPDLDGDIDVPGAPAEDDDGDAGEADEAEQFGEAAPETPVPAPVGESQTPRPDAGDTPTQKEAVVSDGTTTPAVEAAAPVQPAAPQSVTLTNEMFQMLLNAATRGAQAPAAAPVAAPQESAAPVAPVAEAAPAPVAPAAPAAPAPVVESDEQRIARLVNEGVAAGLAAYTKQVQETVAQSGPPTRKGLVGRVTESGELATPGAAGSGELNDHGLPSDWPNKPLHQYTAEERTRFVSPAMMQHVIGNRI